MESIDWCHTEIDAFAFGAGHLENGVVEDEHRDERETKGDDQQDGRVGQRRSPTQETSPVRLFVIVPDFEGGENPPKN
jgi:hypothetical protein